MAEVVFGARPYTYTLSPGRLIPIHGKGTYVRCTSANGAFLLGFNGQSRVPWFQGKWFRAPQGFAWDYVEIENVDTADITVTLEISLGEVGDDRLSVSAPVLLANVDNLRDFDDVAYAGIVPVAAPGAAINGHAQLFNPNGSGTLLVVTSFVATGGAAYRARLDLNTSAGQRPNLIGVGRAKRQSNVTASIGERRHGGVVGVGIPVSSILEFGVPANGAYRHNFFDGPIIVPPNVGIQVINSTANQAFDVAYEWLEVPEGA